MLDDLLIIFDVVEIGVRGGLGGGGEACLVEVVLVLCCFWAVFCVDGSVGCEEDGTPGTCEIDVVDGVNCKELLDEEAEDDAEHEDIFVLPTLFGVCGEWKCWLEDCVRVVFCDDEVLDDDVEEEMDANAEPTLLFVLFVVVLLVLLSNWFCWSSCWFKGDCGLAVES